MIPSKIKLATVSEISTAICRSEKLKKTKDKLNRGR